MRIGSAIGLGLLTLLAFLPLMPVMPHGGLDPSWALAVNEGVAGRMSFGRDLVFTFGPLGAVATRLYHPATDLLTLTASGYIGLATAGALAVLASPGNILALLMFPLLLAAVPVSDAIFLYLPVLFAMAAPKALADRSIPRFARLGVVALMASSLALFPLIKASLAIVAAIAEGAILLACARGSWRHAAAVALASLSAFVGAWVIAGQALSGLPGYLRTSLDLMSGYTTAMALYAVDLPDQMVTVAAFAGVTSLLGWMSLRRSAHGDWRQRAVEGMVVTAAVAMTVKAAFVRYDPLHVPIASGVVLLMAGHAVVSVTPRRAALWMSAVLIAWASLSAAPMSATTRPLTVLADTLRGGYLRLRQPDALAARYREALSGLASPPLAELLDGGVDVYPTDQAVAIANTTKWGPRPVFQSYAAYTPFLAELNAAHLSGSAAPHTLLYRVSAIDGRLPALEDGASWLKILSSYELRSEQDGYAVLRQAPTPAQTASTLIADLDATVGIAVQMPHVEGLVWAEVDWRPTALGQVVAAAFKLPEPRIFIALQGTAGRDFRFVPSVGPAGFLISPLVQDTSDFLSLLDAEAHAPAAPVQSVTFYCGAATRFCGLWSRSIRMRLRRVHFERTGGRTPLH